MTDATLATRVLHHYPGCFGCGSANSAGLQIEVHWDGSEATAEIVPPQHAEGAPGVVHGGYLSTVADEVMALVATEVAGEPAMTKRLALDMRTPVLTGRPLHVRAWVAETAGTRLTLTFEATAAGRPCYAATGIFVTIPMKRWVRAIQAQGRGPESADWLGGDASRFFGWQMAGGLRAVFKAQLLDAPVRIGLELSDIDPPRWTIDADRDGLVAGGRVADDPDVHVAGSFRAWQELIHHTATLDELLAREALTVRGSTGALTRFVRALDFNGA